MTEIQLAPEVDIEEPAEPVGADITQKATDAPKSSESSATEVSDTAITKSLIDESSKKNPFSTIKKYFQNDSEKPLVSRTIHRFVNYVSLILTSLMMTMSISYLSLICKKPCVANMMYMFNISLMFSMFIFQFIYVIYVLVGSYAKNASFWVNIIGTIIIVILASIYTTTYNKQLSKDRKSLMKHKQTMRNLNIASIVFTFILWCVYIYELFIREYSQVEFSAQ